VGWPRGAGWGVWGAVREWEMLARHCAQVRPCDRAHRGGDTSEAEGGLYHRRRGSEALHRHVPCNSRATVSHRSAVTELSPPSNAACTRDTSYAGGVPWYRAASTSTSAATGKVSPPLRRSTDANAARKSARVMPLRAGVSGALRPTGQRGGVHRHRRIRPSLRYACTRTQKATRDPES